MRWLGRLVILLGVALAAWPFVTQSQALGTDHAVLSGRSVAAGTTPAPVFLPVVFNNVLPSAGTLVATISLPATPLTVAVNPTTDRIYAVTDAGTLVVIDGQTNQLVTSIPLPHPYYLAVDPTTNRVYVTTYTAWSQGTAITVLDGASNAVIATIPVGISGGLAVNSTTHDLYQGSVGFGLPSDTQILVVNGLSYAYLAAIPIGGLYDSMGVIANPNTNLAYVASALSYPSDPTAPNNAEISVINGATNTVTTSLPFNTIDALAVDPTTNLLYALVQNAPTAPSNLLLIDGTTSSIRMTVPLAPLAGAGGLVADPSTGQIYLCGWSSSDQGLIGDVDETQNKIIATVALGSAGFGCPMALDPTTSVIYLSLDFAL